MTTCAETLSSLSASRDKGRPLVILAGAGISIPSGLPAARDVMELAIRHCAAGREVRPLLRLLDRERPRRRGPGDWLRFEGVVEAMRRTIDPDLHVLELLSGNVRPSAGHRALARLLRAGYCAITTNFDCLIEEACRDEGVKIEAAFRPEHFEANAKAHEARRPLPYPLIKVHGSIEDLSSIQASLSSIGDQRTAFRPESAVWKLLHRVLAQSDVFVVGYSGADDYDIVPLLLQTESQATLCWVIHDPRQNGTCRIIDRREWRKWPVDTLGFFRHPVAAIANELIAMNTRTPDATQLLIGDGTGALCTLADAVLQEITFESTADSSAVAHAELSSPLWSSLATDSQRRCLFTAHLYRSCGRIRKSREYFFRAMRRPRKREFEDVVRAYEAWLEYVELSFDMPASDETPEVQRTEDHAIYVSRAPSATLHSLKGSFGIALFYELAGVLKESRGLLDHAVAYCDLALQVLSKNEDILVRTPYILLRKGCLLLKREDPQAALHVLETARDAFLHAGRMSETADVLFELSACHQRMGNDLAAAAARISCRHFAGASANRRILAKLKSSAA